MGSYQTLSCAEQAAPPEDQQIETIKMPSAEEWSACAQTLQSYQQEHRGFINKLGRFITDYASHTSAISTTLLLAFFGKQFSDYFELEGARLVATAGGASYGIYALCNRMVEWIGRRMANKAEEDFYALESLIRNWQQHKEFTPLTLHPLFDDLAHDYAKHHALGLTSEQAQIIVEQIIQTAELGQALTEAMGLNFKRSEDDSLVGIVPFFLATRINIGLNLKDCILQCGNNPNKAKHNQWEHIARQLGILKQPRFMESVAHFAQNYQWPLALGIGMPTGFVAGVKIANYLTHRDPYYWRLGRMLGTAGGVAALSLFFKLLIKAGSDTNWRSTHLLKFVMNWNGQKHNTPPCLHTLFEQLHRLYLKNHRSLQLDPLFVDELYQIILEAWMMSLVPAEQPEEPEHHNTTNATETNN
jgi:hypothetical protein